MLTINIWCIDPVLQRSLGYGGSLIGQGTRRNLESGGGSPKLIVSGVPEQPEIVHL